ARSRARPERASAWSAPVARKAIASARADGGQLRIRAPNRDESVSLSASRSQSVAVKGEPKLRQASARNLKGARTWGVRFALGALRLVPSARTGMYACG